MNTRMIKQLFCRSMALMMSLILVGCSSDPSRENVSYDTNKGCYVYTDKIIEKHYEEIEEGELMGVIMTWAQIIGDHSDDPTLMIPQTIYEKDIEKEVVGISVDAIDRSIKKVESSSAHFIVNDGCVYENSSILVHVPYGEDTLNIPQLNSIILTYLSRCTEINSSSPMVINVPSTIQDIYIGKIATNIYWNVETDNANYSSEHGCLYDKNKNTLIKFYDQPIYTIPSTVKKIKEYAFYKAVQLKKLTIAPEIVTERNYALDADIAINGRLYGEFSVSPYKKVHFSQGNLQYQASTNTWRFAENQYEYIGEENEKISPTNDGWMDLFTAGTGNNPTKINCQVADYHSSTFVDWGVNKISNGGNIENIWRTLSAKEWNYILNERPNAHKLHGYAIINNGKNIYGHIILPDGWVMPSDLHFTEDPNYARFNTYSIREWEQMEATGAVFMPFAGRCNNNGYKINVDDIRMSGHYWTTSIADDKSSYELYFSHTFINLTQSYHYWGNSVRLVK